MDAATLPRIFLSFMTKRRYIQQDPPPIDAEVLEPLDSQGAQARAVVPEVDLDGTLRSGRLAGMTMTKAIWVLAWPILIESYLNSFVGLTDTVLAAGISENATDAIAGASYITWFIGLVTMAIGVGATALVSRSAGAGRMAVANAVLGQTMLLAVLSGIVLGAIIAVLAPFVTRVLNMSPQASQSFIIYMRIVAAGVPFTSILFGGIACSRGVGESLKPLGVMAVVNIVNMLTSFLLSGVDLTTTTVSQGISHTRILLHNPLSLDLGVPGIALGTLIGHAVGAALMLALLMYGFSGMKLKRRRLKPHWHTTRRLIKIGLPNFLETFGLWIGNFLILLMVGLLGSSGLLGAHIVAIRIEAMSFLPGFAMGSAAATLAGQYLGAKKPHMARKAVIRCAAIAAFVMGLMGLAFVLIPEQIVGLITSQPTHLELAPSLIRVCGYVQIPFAFAIVFRGALRGAGDVRVVMILTWIVTYAIRLPAAYILSGVDITTTSIVDGHEIRRVLLENPFGFQGSLTWLWIALCGELVIRCVLFSIRMMQGGWTRIRV